MFALLRNVNLRISQKTASGVLKWAVIVIPALAILVASPVELAAEFNWNGLANQAINQTVDQVQKQQSAQKQQQSKPINSNNSQPILNTVNGVPTWGGTGGKIRILSGTGSFASVSDAHNVLNVSPGAALNGTIELSILNLGPSGAVAPLIYTPSWGDHSTSWREVSDWVPTGQSEQQAQVSLVAPTTPGTYHIIFAMCWEVGGVHVASGTTWTLENDVWNDRNDIAEFNATQLSSAQLNGWAMNNEMYGPDSSHSTTWYQQRYYPADAITLVVTANGSSTATSTSSGSANLVPNSFAKFLASQAGKNPPDFSSLVDVSLADSIWRDGVTIAVAVQNPDTIKNLSGGVQFLWKYMVVPVDGPMFKVMTGPDPSADQVVTAFAWVGSIDAVPPPTTDQEITAMLSGVATLVTMGMSDYFAPIIADLGNVKFALSSWSLGNQIKTLQDARKKGCLIGGGVGVIAYYEYAKTLNKPLVVVFTTANPLINSVSAVAPEQTQTITISGSGFGAQNAFNGISKFLKIHDDTANWDAGYSGDWVNLNVSQWTDTQIVINGFTGAYGLSEWKLNAGDKLTVLVWNAQSGNGPATFNVTVNLNQ